jgi:glycerol-3-phosphate acyltransferase PlsY
MSYLILTLIVAIPSYVIGSINGAIITSWLFYRKDIRGFGSGNPGLTNFFRTFGKGGALLVVLIDMFKTITPVVFGGWLFAIFTDTPVSPTWLLSRFFEVSLLGITVSGFFVMLGHCFPVFYKFKGGKGVMTVGAMLIMLDWRLALICWMIFLLLILATRYVSLGAIVACSSMPFIMYFVLGLGGIFEFIALLLCACLTVVRHEDNIKRLIKGNESKVKFRRKKT